MQSSLPHNTAFNPSNIPANPSALSLSPNSIPITTSVPVCTTVGVSVSSAGDSAPTAAPHISEGDIQSAILDNLFGHRTSVSGSANSSRLFQTSSDTVNQLLRGLNTKTQSESIQKLSRDTASVLPTFARVLESSIGSQPLSAPGAVCSDGDGAGGPVRDVEEGEGGGDDRLGEGELSLASVTGMKYMYTCTLHTYMYMYMYMSMFMYCTSLCTHTCTCTCWFTWCACMETLVHVYINLLELTR